MASTASWLMRGTPKALHRKNSQLGRSSQSLFFLLTHLSGRSKNQARKFSDAISHLFPIGSLHCGNGLFDTYNHGPWSPAATSGSPFKSLEVTSMPKSTVENASYPLILNDIKCILDDIRCKSIIDELGDNPMESPWNREIFGILKWGTLVPYVWPYFMGMFPEI